MALVRILKDKWVHPPAPVTESFKGRNVIVTGATAGIGVEVVYKFAKLGASKVIIAARNLKKGEATKAALGLRLGREDQLEVWELDMASYASIVAFAKRAEGLDHLDVAILNAGVHRSKYEKSNHGWEEDLQVMVLSTTLLGILLLPKLKASKKPSGKTPVLEFVNSGLHMNAKVSDKAQEEASILEWYNRPENFSEGVQYSNTKLFLRHATNKLAKIVPSSSVNITSVCPGIVKSDLGRDHYFPGVGVLIFVAGLLILQSTEQGANPLLSGTTQGEKLHGGFWKSDKMHPDVPSIAGPENEKIGERVWTEIVESLKKAVPEVSEALESIKG